MKGVPKGNGKGATPLRKPKTVVKKLTPKAVLPPVWTHVSLAKALSQGRPDLRQSRQVRNWLEKKFGWDYSDKHFSVKNRHRLAEIRAGIWWRLFSSSTKRRRWPELRQAKVSIPALRRLKHHICPLGFQSRKQLGSMMSDLSKAIPAGWGSHKIVLSGSATTFYSENPDKTDPKGDYHWFDKSKKGDYDLSISFDHLSRPRAALGPPSTAEWGSYWGTSAVTNAIDFRAFYAKWGFHPFGKYPKTRTILNRDIGVVILNYGYRESATFCRFWKKDYIWDSKTKDFVQPKYGVWRTETRGKITGARRRIPKGAGKGGKRGK